MRLLIRLALVSFFLASVSYSQETVHSSTLTLGFGGETTHGSSPQSDGPAFKVNYEYRLAKYFAVEAGTEMLFPKSTQYLPISFIFSGRNLTNYFNAYAFVPYSERTHIATVPFGIKGILPLANGRFELFAGGGGACGWNSYRYYNSWFAQASLGGRFALDTKNGSGSAQAVATPII